MKFRQQLTMIAAATAALSASATAQAADPAMRGKMLFLQCAACHSAAKGAPAKVGPNLYGVFGRQAGSAPGFSYSAAMKAARFRWDEAKLDAWLTTPSKVVPGTIMLFPGLPRPEDRQAVIAYLRTLK